MRNGKFGDFFKKLSLFFKDFLSVGLRKGLFCNSALLMLNLFLQSLVLLVFILSLFFTLPVDTVAKCLFVIVRIEVDNRYLFIVHRLSVSVTYRFRFWVSFIVFSYVTFFMLYDKRYLTVTETVLRNQF